MNRDSTKDDTMISNLSLYIKYYIHIRVYYMFIIFLISLARIPWSYKEERLINH